MKLSGFLGDIGLSDLGFLGQTRDDVDRLYSELADYLGAAMGGGAELKFPGDITAIRGQMTKIARYIVESKDSMSAKYAETKKVYDDVMPKLRGMMDDLRRGPVMSPAYEAHGVTTPMGPVTPPPVNVPRPGLPSEVATPAEGKSGQMGPVIMPEPATPGWVMPVMFAGLAVAGYWLLMRQPSANPRRAHRCRNPKTCTNPSHWGICGDRG
jgi:hypothetical protein